MSERTEILLKEYESCQKTVERLEDAIWKTSGFTTLGSAGAIIGVLLKNDGIHIGIYQKIILGIFVFAVSWLWTQIIKRWHSIQIVTFIRMKHIEEELGMYLTRYVSHKDRHGKK